MRTVAHSLAQCNLNFDQTEILANGGWSPGDGNDGRDPGLCLQVCRAQFLSSLVAGTSELTEELCAILTAPAPDYQLWPLYWCDAHFCGVGIEQNGSMGQDPIVDDIIDQCQNIGFYSIYDPGPQPEDYACPISSPEVALSTTTLSPPGHPSTTATGRVAVTAVVRTSLSDTSVPHAAPTEDSVPETIGSSTQTTAVSVSKTEERATDSTMATATSTTTFSGAPVASGSIEPTPVGPNQTFNSAPSSAGTASNELSGGVRAAIATTSSVVLVILILLALYFGLLRRRRNSASPFGATKGIRLSDCNEDRGCQHATGAGLLFSSTGSSADTGGGDRAEPNLKPPPRLSDRKFLLPGLLLRHSERSQSPPLTPLTPNNTAAEPVVIPASPIWSPTTSKLVPRHERSPSIRGPPAPGTYWPKTNTSTTSTGHGPDHRGSLGISVSPSTTATSSLRNEVGAMIPVSPISPLEGPSSSAAPTVSLPTRPARPHEAPLEIPDLIRPAERSLPPNRALPTLPPKGAGSTGSEMAARKTTVKTASSLQDYAETRESWGSWSGAAAGIAMTTNVAARSGSDRCFRAGDKKNIEDDGRPMGSPVLREEDLERLGGKY